MTFPSALAMCVLVLYSTVSPFIQGKCHVIRNNKKQLLTAAQKNLTLKWRFRCRSGGRSNTLVRTEISQHLLDQFLWLFFTDIHGPRSVTTSDIQTPRDFSPSTTMRFDIREVKCLDNYLRGWNIPYVRWESPHSKHRCLTRTPTLLSIFFRLTEADTQISIFSSMVHAVLVNWVCFAHRHRSRGVFFNLTVDEGNSPLRVGWRIKCLLYKLQVNRIITDPLLLLCVWLMSPVGNFSLLWWHCTSSNHFKVYLVPKGIRLFKSQSFITFQFYSKHSNCISSHPFLILMEETPPFFFSYSIFHLNNLNI